MTVAECRRRGREALLAAGIDPDAASLESDWLLADALRTDRLHLLADPGIEADLPGCEAFESALARRTRREPLQYVRGSCEFHGVRLRCDPRALIPRPETETLVDECVRRARGFGGRCRIADVGTGTGAVALALASALPETEIVATDLSAEALSLARENAASLGLSLRLSFLRGALASPLRGQPPFDLIAANLPYLTEAELAAAAPELRFEPRGALVSDADDGTSAMRRLIPQARLCLAPGGWLLLECAPAQARGLALAFGAADYAEAAVARDATGRDRVVSGRLPKG